MSICSISMKEKFDLREGTVAEGWDQFLQPIRERKTTRVTKCTACHLKSACGMCPANAELENGDAETPVEFLCHVAHLRAELFGWTVPAHGECEFCEGGIDRARVVQGGAYLREAHAGGERGAAGADAASSVVRSGRAKDRVRHGSGAREIRR